MDNRLANDLNHILDHTRDLWEELRGQRIFITGGTGFFGCWLMESFIWANDRLKLDCQATVLTRSPESFRAKAPHLALNESVSLLKGDILTYDFPPGTFSHIIHAATESSVLPADSNPLSMFNNIVNGTQHTLNLSNKSNARKFLLTSSGAVYGKQPPDITHISEEFSGAPDPLNPKSTYAEAKRMSEHLCVLYANPLFETKIARCFAFVGPYLPMEAHFAIGNFIRDGLTGGPIIIKGDGTPRRSYLYAADLMVWLWIILFKGPPKRAYNVGSDIELSIGNLAEIVAKNFIPEVQIERRDNPDPQKPVERYVPSIQRAKSELGLSPLVDLQTAINKTIKFQKTQ